MQIVQECPLKQSSMVNFNLYLLNFPVERLFKPRKRLAGVSIPDYIKNSLPFKEEGIDDINEESDVILFTEYFCDLGFDNCKDLIEYVTSHTFYKSIKGTENKEGESKIITTLKYLFVAKRVLQGLVADDTAFSFHLPYLSEACYDLECSVLLVQESFVKQALQTLRNVLEVSLTHAYYAFNDMDYDDLIASDDHRIPNFKDLIKFFRAENFLTPEMERQLFELYKILSGAVHSEVLKLNCNTPADYTTFLEWYNLYLKVIRMYFLVIIRLIEVGV